MNHIRYPSSPYGSRAFSLIELLVVIAVVALLMSILLPALMEARRAARQIVCMANLQQYGRAHQLYAGDFRLYIAAFNGTPKVHPIGHIGFPTHQSLEAQAAAIIDRYASRDEPLDRYSPDNTLGGVALIEQHSHLVLAGTVFAGLGMEIAVCPEDSARLGWRRDPLTPERWPHRPQKDANKKVEPWLAYSSSYQLMPSGATKKHPGGYYQSYDDHGTYLWGEKFSAFGRRRIDEVSFPSMKVAVADTQQRHRGQDLFFAYAQAQQPVLFWDGSVSIRRTADANPGCRPGTPKGLVSENVYYRPDDGFESPRLAGAPARLTGVYRWTRGGLRGVDFGGSEALGGQQY